MDKTLLWEISVLLAPQEFKPMKTIFYHCYCVNGHLEVLTEALDCLHILTTDAN